ncbi:MAG: sigma-54 dependent transcriptional regulator [Candidatus Accumulibacter sp.]|jgi:two-component system response regulator PilR (NtrC family)|nr:sigma-54 dependent transcriptional regulator [Accumulibacter sp.]
MSMEKTRRRHEDLPRVLVIDDEEDIRELLELTIMRMGLPVDCADSVAEAKRWLRKERYSLCLTDMRLPDGEGLEIVRLIGAEYGQTPVAVITAYGSVDNVRAAYKAGAFDYLEKPVELDELRTLIKSAVNLPKVDASPGKTGRSTGQLTGESPAIVAVREMIDKLARSQAPVHISGESGSGKEVAARLIHQCGSRRAAPFIPVNCGAIPENLMESEFFGYRKGAFTGAEGDRDGFFQTASGGTLFLDEVADLPLPMQVKLLRAIQEKKVRKVGSAVEEPVDIRIISATHRSLKDCVDTGAFRQDLYYRLNVIELRMPALRERREDIPLLAEAMLSRMYPENRPRLTDEAMRALCNYDYPGNVRELENILERATALCLDNRVDLADLQLAEDPAVGAGEEPTGETLDDRLNQVERQSILEALAKTGFNRTAAARLLGVTFRSLRYRIERLGIEDETGG